MMYFKNVLIGLDQFLWTILGGSPDETISAAMWRLEHEGNRWAIPIRKFIDYIALKVFGQENHCKLSFEAEKDKK